MTRIVDASVALKWTLDEDGSAQARTLIAQPGLQAPDFLILECANVLALKVRAGKLDGFAARYALQAIETKARVDLRPSRPYMDDAHLLAQELGRSAYDCLYLAAAIQASGQMVTADEKLYRAVSAHGVYRRFIELL